ncbi:cupin domain-containing protein [Pyrodictium occultum]|uniref:cupin domain-containing protein n=1 Tax=Pyrodictium occultum TaxID=2309 RepID=UPI001F46BCF5|nr:cupin domain-containing protein [Pyrodictium occultum]
MERGPCGEKVGRAVDVEASEASVGGEKLPGVYIRWLVSDKDGAPTFAMRMFTAEPGSHIPGHSHPWEHEIFVLSGSMRVRIGEREYAVGQGDFLYIPPNVHHEYFVGDKGVVFLCMIPLKPSVGEDYNPCKKG